MAPPALAAAVLRDVLAISRAARDRKLIEHAQGSSETVAAQLSPICAARRPGRQTRRKVITDRDAMDHMTLNSVVVRGGSVTRKWPAASPLNNSQQRNYSNAWPVP